MIFDYPETKTDDNESVDSGENRRRVLDVSNEERLALIANLKETVMK